MKVALVDDGGGAFFFSAAGAGGSFLLLGCRCRWSIHQLLGCRCSFVGDDRIRQQEVGDDSRPYPAAAVAQ
jgi:hypothetical protein